MPKATAMYKEYGLIGSPLGHSLSERLFNRLFAALGLQARYLNFELRDISELMELIGESPDLRGLNVTMPYKQAVIPLLDRVHTPADVIGAVNVVRIVRMSDGDIRLEGYNTDAPALLAVLQPRLRRGDSRCLVLGTGGGARAAHRAAEMAGLRTAMASRTPGAHPRAVDYDEIGRLRDYDVVINALPVGVTPLLRYDELRAETLCLDLNYRPRVTGFMAQARARGARTENGMGMLHLQAAMSWEIWNGSVE